MRRFLFLAILSVLGGCNDAAQPPEKSGDAPISSSKASPTKPVNGSPDRAAKAPEPDPESAEAAVAVLRRYYAAIEAGDYASAWLLWGDSGAESGMTREEFAASFGKYRSYRAEIGAPGESDAGMMQRWISIPVKISGKLEDGRSFAMEGPVILHHVAMDMKEVPLEDRLWRIRDTSGVKPRPS